MANVNGEGCFTYAAFLVLDGDDHRGFLGGRDWGLGYRVLGVGLR